MSAYDEKSALTLLASVLSNLPEDATIVVVAAAYRIAKNTVTKLAEEAGDSACLRRDIDRTKAIINKRKIYGVSVARVDKIRGLRPTLLVIVEPLMIPRETLKELSGVFCENKKMEYPQASAIEVWFGGSY